MDSGASTHMTLDFGNLLFTYPPSTSHPANVVVGNGPLLSITSTGHTFFRLLFVPFILPMYWLLPALLKILFMYVSLPLIIIALLSLIYMVFP